MQESRNALIWLDDRQVGQVEVWNKAQDETGFGSASFERSTGFTGSERTREQDDRSATPHLLAEGGRGAGEATWRSVDMGCRWGSDEAGVRGLPRKVSRLAQ